MKYFSILSILMCSVQAASKSNYNDTYIVINVSTLSMKPLQIDDLYTFVVLLSGSNVAKYLTHSVSTLNNISIEVNF